VFKRLFGRKNSEDDVFGGLGSASSGASVGPVPDSSVPAGQSAQASPMPYGSGDLQDVPAEVQDMIQQFQSSFPGMHVQVQNREIAAQQNPDLIRSLEATTGMDLDGDGQVATPVAADPDAARLEQLERLAKLRDSGALSPDEFEREKKRLLDAG
jgi:Short C-terminal domain